MCFLSTMGLVHSNTWAMDVYLEEKNQSVNGVINSDVNQYVRMF